MSLPFIKTDAAAEELLEESQRGGSFELLPKGWYEGTVKKVEVVDFAKSGKYNEQGYKALNVQLRIIDSSEVGAGRVFFLRVPLFQRYLPTAKNPQGAVAQTYFDFFLAMGFTKEQVAKADVKIDQAALGGKAIGFSLTVKEADEWNDAPYNEVGYVRESREPAKTSAVGNAFAPQAGAESPWGSAETTTAPQGDATLQAAAEGAGKAF